VVDFLASILMPVSTLVREEKSNWGDKSTSALRRTLAICDNYAKEYSISFNASKSKCLVVLPGNRQWLSDFVGDNPCFMEETFVTSLEIAILKSLLFVAAFKRMLVVRK